MNLFQNIRNKSLLLVLAIVVIIAVLGIFKDNPILINDGYYPNITRVEFNDEISVSVETATTPYEKGKGLMYRDELGENNGMLFMYSEPIEGRYWMKNTLIPLDMIFINSDYEIIYIVENAQPCVSDPCEHYGPTDMEYQYVLEVNGGWVKQQGDVRLDDKLTFYISEE